MKKIIIGKTGTGKSKMCFDIANKYKGTVAYLSNVCIAEKHYEKFGVLKDYEVHKLTKSIFMENFKKYFIIPAKESSSLNSLVPILGLDLKNDFTQKLTSNILLIIDDGLWGVCDNKALLLWKLSHSNTDILVTVSDWEELLNDSEISEKMKKDIRQKWKVIELQANSHKC